MSPLIFFCLVCALIYLFIKLHKLSQKTDQLTTDISTTTELLHGATQRIHVLSVQLNQLTAVQSSANFTLQEVPQTLAQVKTTPPLSNNVPRETQVIATPTASIVAQGVIPIHANSDHALLSKSELMRESIKKRIYIYAKKRIQTALAQLNAPSTIPSTFSLERSNQSTFTDPTPMLDIKVAKQAVLDQSLPELVLPEPCVPNTKTEPKREKSPNDTSSTTYYTDIPSPISIWFKKGLAWFLEGNPLAKLGIGILFIGFGFLLKLGIEKNIIPIELRLLMTAVISTSLFIIGWCLRFKNRSFALAMQGGGLGGLYFIAYAAYKFFNVLPYEFTMISMLGICALIVFFAIKQTGESLAFLALLGGFTAPILMSTGTGNFAQLLGFYTILSLGITALSMRFNWRSLQILGVFMVFGVCAGVGFVLEKYDPSQFVISQIYLLINFILYGILLLIINEIHLQKNNQGILNNYAPQLSVGLLFGVPLMGFAIEYGLVQHLQYGAAIAAFILGLIYITCAFVFYKGIPYKNITIDLTTESYFFRALGAGFVTLSIPLAFSLHFTSIAWTIEGCVLLLLNHRQIPKITYILGSLLVAASAILSLNILNISTGQLTFNGFDLDNPLLLPITNDNLITWAINTLALMICAWRWMTLATDNTNTTNLQRDNDDFSPATFFKPYAHLLSTIFLTAGIGFWVFDGFQVALSIWSKAMPFNPQLYGFLGILSVSALIWHSIAKQFEWNGLFNAIFVFFGLGIIITVQLVGISDWSNAGMLNLVWLLVIPIATYLCYDYLKNEFEYANVFSSITLLWSLLIFNKLIIPYVDLAYLLGVQSLILALLFTRFTVLSRIFISPNFMLYLATAFALSGMPYYYLNHSTFELSNISSVLGLSCLVFYVSYIWEHYGSDDSAVLPSSSAKLNQNWAGSHEISLFTLVIGGIYLSYTLFSATHYFNQFIDNAHFISIGLLLTTMLIPITSSIANLCRWKELKYIQIIGLIALITALFTQFAWIQAEFSNNLTNPTSVYIWQSITLIISLMVHYYALSKSVLPRIVTQVLHAILGVCVIVAGINLGYFLNFKYNMADSQLIYLAIFSLLLIGFNWIYRLNKQLSIAASVYEFGLIGGLSGLTLGYLLFCFFKAPMGIYGVYLPLLNPLESILSIALFGLYLSLNQPLIRAYHSMFFDSFVTKHSVKRMIMINIFGLMLANIILARAVSVYFNIDWNLMALWQSKLLQASISLIWTSFALVMMIKSKQRNSMDHWIAGAFPLLLVIIKLFLVDSAKGGGIIRALLFVIIALFVIAISYYAPPPLKTSQE